MFREMATRYRAQTQAGRQQHPRSALVALLLLLRVSAVQPCRSEFDSLQDRALGAQFVIVGKIAALLPPATPGGAARVADVSVQRVLKDEGSSSAGSNGGGLPRLGGISQLNVFGFTDRGASQPKDCLSAVTVGDSYFLFINASAAAGVPYRSVKLAARYSKRDEDTLRDANCANCAIPPRVRTRKLTETSDGSIDISLVCTVEAAQQVRIAWFKGGRDLAQNARFQLQRRDNKKRKVIALTARLKQAQPADAGEYVCIARNAMGSSSSSIKLPVASLVTASQVRSVSMRPTQLPADMNVSTTQSQPSSPPHPWSSDGNYSQSSTLLPAFQSVTPAVTAETVAVSPATADVLTLRSHYVSCTEKDTKFCLHGGICLMKPDGRDRHCRCVSQYTGARCEEKFIQWTFRPPEEVSPLVGDIKNDVIAALATALGVVLVAVCVSKLVCSKQPCPEWRWCRSSSGSMDVEQVPVSVLAVRSRRRPPSVTADDGVLERLCEAAAENGSSKSPLSSSQPALQSRSRCTSDQACQTEAASLPRPPHSIGCLHFANPADDDIGPPETATQPRAVPPCMCCSSRSTTVTDLERQADLQAYSAKPGGTKRTVDGSSKDHINTDKANCDYFDDRLSSNGLHASATDDVE